MLAMAADKSAEAEFRLKKRLRDQKSRGPDPRAIAAFKAKQQREEQERLRKAQQEKAKLMALRAQSGKSMRRTKVMQSRTKVREKERKRVG